MLFLNLIAAILLVTLAEPIVRLLFERGAFTADSTVRATLALMCLAPGLVMFSTVNILARAFFALGDTKTPMQISIVCLTMNRFVAAAAARAVAAGRPRHCQHAHLGLNVGLLLFALRKKLGKLELESLRTTFLPLALLPAFWPDWWRGRAGGCGKIPSATRPSR